jgi:hypothetical protein
MTDALLARLAREDPAADLPALALEEIIVRITAAEEVPSRATRPSRPVLPRRAPRAVWSVAAAVIVVGLVLAALRPSAESRSSAQPSDPRLASAAVHFAVLRSGSRVAMPPAVAAGMTRVLHEAVAETRRVVSAYGTIWIVVGSHGRLCLTLVTAGRTRTLGIACGSEAEAIRTGIRLAGRLSAGASVVVGILPDGISHTSVSTSSGRRLHLPVRHNVYATEFTRSRATRPAVD